MILGWLRNFINRFINLFFFIKSLLIGKILFGNTIEEVKKVEEVKAENKIDEEKEENTIEEVNTESKEENTIEEEKEENTIEEVNTESKEENTIEEVNTELKEENTIEEVNTELKEENTIEEVNTESKEENTIEEVKMESKEENTIEEVNTEFERPKTSKRKRRINIDTSRLKKVKLNPDTLSRLLKPIYLSNETINILNLSRDKSISRLSFYTRIYRYILKNRLTRNNNILLDEGLSKIVNEDRGESVVDINREPYITLFALQKILNRKE